MAAGVECAEKRKRGEEVRIHLCSDAADEAERIIGMCQRAWGLRDWEIGVRVVSAEEMVANEGRHCFGAIRFHDQPRLATVLLAREAEVKPSYTVPPIAFTVAHEVAHIVVGELQGVCERLLASLAPDTVKRVAEDCDRATEAICDTFARALVNQREVAVWDANDLPEGWEVAVEE